MNAFLRLAAAVALAVPALAVAGAMQDYAWQWSLPTADERAGAYRVILDEEIYRQAQSPQLKDVVVVDGAGNPVPMEVLAPEQPLARSPRYENLPWFSLPAASGAGRSGPGWELISEVETDGRLRRVEARSTPGEAAELPQTALLLDASAVGAPILALQLEWTPGPSLDAAYRIEASDDLDRWRSVASSGRLVDLWRDGQRLQQRRLVFDAVGEQARYLRLTPLDPKAVAPITRVSAEIADDPARTPPNWRELRGKRVETAGGGEAFEFELDARLPVQWVNVALPGNHALQWRLDSRDSPGAEWVARAGPWMAYRVDGQNQDSEEGDRSAPRELNRSTRDRYWRLRAGSAVPGEPVLMLGYRPEVAVFLAQGAPPYTLLVGSARAQRADSQLPQLIQALRKARGPAWQAAEAELGTTRQAAGDSALVPPVPQRDWRSWTLWAVLVLGALIVVGFALSLLRSGKPAAD